MKTEKKHGVYKEAGKNFSPRRVHKWMLTNPIAHRGLHDALTPENSLAAFEQAIRKGTAIELDVQLTKDERVVVFHDDNVKRMTGFDGELEKMTLDELKQLRLKGTEERIPTFDEVLDLVDCKAPMLVEIKKHKKELERLVIERLHTYEGEYAIQAFNPFVLRNVRKLDPTIVCGLLSSKFEDMKLMRIKKAGIKNARLFFIGKPDFLSFEIHSFPNDRIDDFRKKLGLPVLAWTVRSKEELERAKNFCDNIIFENINALQEHFARLGSNLATFEKNIVQAVKNTTLV
ncbi:MAG: glycerophosphodiester phosphodiesterase [Clostridiales Family XIII bacterium]|jgi:glycerophosphoryl diester phosphodiesterase|nr:glycerophosphodiester phosphodiesterase [Clostridiales Family XIII bacterium]